MNVDLKYINLKEKERIIKLEWESCVAAGYTGRNREAVLAHIKELKDLGVPTPEKISAMYWIEPERVSTSSKLYVIGNKTSGEVEYFLAKSSNGEMYMTIASDHTDREIEKLSVSKAKQMCSKIIAKDCWKVSDIYDHWDEIIITLKIKEKDNSPEILYQEGALGSILLPEKLEEICFNDRPIKKGNIAIFSGTLPLASNETIFAKIYKLVMYDPIIKREINHVYKIFTLPDRS